MDSVSAKAALRKDVLARRSLVTETQRQAFAERLASVGAAFAAEKQASLASVFWSIGDEPPTLPLLQSLARQGIAIRRGDEIEQDAAKAFDDGMGPLEPDADFKNLMDAAFVDCSHRSPRDPQ